jgi:hypothetical protein
MTVKIQVEIGIICGYLLLLAGAIFWNLQPFHLLLSLLIEYGCLLIVYLYISIRLSKSILDKFMSTISHLSNGVALGIVQGALVMLMAYIQEGKVSFNEKLSDLPQLILVISIPMLILQFLAIRGKTKNQELQDEKMGELVLSAVAFPAIILSGMLAFELSDENKRTTLITIVSMRIIFEIWNNHFKKRPQKKQKKIPNG